MRRYKRVDVLLRAFAVVRAAIPDATLDLIGDGPEATALRQLAASLNLNAPTVTFHGAVDEATKWALLRRATVLAQPSMKEGWGRTVLEAGAVGVPSVVSDVPGLRDAVRPEISGLLVKPDDPVALATSIIRLLHDRSARRRLGEGARAVAAAYRWDATTDVIEASLAGAVRDTALVSVPAHAADGVVTATADLSVPAASSTPSAAPSQVTTGTESVAGPVVPPSREVRWPVPGMVPRALQAAVAFSARARAVWRPQIGRAHV